MKDILFFVAAGVAGLATFLLVARRYRNDCVP